MSRKGWAVTVAACSAIIRAWLGRGNAVVWEQTGDAAPGDAARRLIIETRSAPVSVARLRLARQRTKGRLAVL